MKTYTLSLLLILIFTSNFYSQNTFEPGYLIKKGEKINCFIKNKDWKNTPNKISYKICDTLTDCETISIEELNEFSINNNSKFKKFEIELDLSSNQVEKMDDNPNPNFKKQFVFLKVIIEGKASLYSYENEDFTRYFYSIDGNQVQQLIYKKFLSKNTDLGNNRFVLENSTFRNQLFENLNCNNQTKSDFDIIKYELKDLKTIFQSYNECHSSNYVIYETKIKKGEFHLAIRPGLDFNTFDFSTTPLSSLSLENNLSFRIGAAFEFVAPFNNNKWALTLEPTYRAFKTNGYYDPQNGINTASKVKVDYSSITIPFGIKHNMFINKNAHIFLTAVASFNLILDASINLPPSEQDYFVYVVKRRNDFGLGVGYAYKKLSVEFKHYLNLESGEKYDFFTSPIRYSSLLFGYRIF